MTVRGYTLAVDWSTQGEYTLTGEDVSGRVAHGDIEVSWGRQMDSEVTLKATSATGSFALTNHDRYLSPENTSSPLNGKILPGRRVRFQKVNPTTLFRHTLIAGVLDDYKVAADAARTFTGSILDSWGRPGAEKLSTPLYSGLRTGAAIHLVLDAIGWTGGRDIDPGATVMPWWWEEGSDASTAVEKLVASEGAPAIAYVAGGTFVYRDRHHRLINTRSQVSQALITHIEPVPGPGGDLKIEEGRWDYDHGVRQIVNTAVFAVDIRTPAVLSEVWSTDDAVTIGAGQTLLLTVQSTDPFLGAIVPVVDTDLLVQSGNVTAVSLSRTSGQAAVLSITCSTATVITRLAVRAHPVTVRRTVQVRASDTSSVSAFGVQNWPDTDNPTWAGPYDAQAIATRIVAVYATYRPIITLTVYALNDTYLAALLELAVSDRVTIRHDPMGINRAFMVERITHTVTSLQQHRVTLTCVAAEPTQPANQLLFDVAGRGFNDGAFAVEGIDNPGTMFRFDTAGQGFDQAVFAT